MAGFGLGGTEMLILLLAVIFLFFGGKKLPELARGLGRAMAEFQRGRQQVEQEIGDAVPGDAAPRGAPGSTPPVPALKKLDYDAAAMQGADPRDSKVVVAARALGIATEGKTEEELKAEIARLMAQPMKEAAR